MKIEYVQAADEDRKFYIKVHHAAYRAVIAQVYGWDQALQDRLTADAFDQGGKKIICVNGERVGVVEWFVHDDHVRVSELYLLPEFQGQGIGGHVVADIIQLAKQAGTHVRLRTLKPNVRAVAFYERNGFRITEVTDRHWNLVFQPIAG